MTHEVRDKGRQLQKENRADEIGESLGTNFL